MSDKEKKILETITKAIPTMSDFDKGYLLGMGEAIAGNKNPESEEGESSEPSSDL